MNQPNKAAMAKFSVLKGSHPQLTPMRMATLKCAGQCTCRCCKWVPELGRRDKRKFCLSDSLLYRI